MYINSAYLAAHLLKSFNIIIDYILAYNQQNGAKAVRGNISLSTSKGLQ